MGITGTTAKGINRIRLEFKGERIFELIELLYVLIESDWNLKEVILCPVDLSDRRINRIRLEFKGSIFAV